MPYKRLKAGDRVGEWVVEEKAGEGQGSEVWKARHHLLDIRASIKVIFSEDGAEALRRAGVAQHAFRHDRVPRTLGLDLDRDPPYFASEWVDGAPLRRLLDEKGPLPWDRVLVILRDVLSVLVAVHERGETHGNLRPSNILVDPEGRAHLRDFQGSRPGRREGEDLLSGVFADRREAELKTDPYRAPEAAEGAPSGPREDVWSAGLILFEALTGRLPQGSERPSDFVKDLPAAADKVFRGAYARPERRYADAAAMGAELLPREFASEPDELVASVVRGPAPGAAPEPGPAATGASPAARAPAEPGPCPLCGYRNQEGYRFCVACGKPLPPPAPARTAPAGVSAAAPHPAPAPAPAACRRCGKPRQPSFRFCVFCGERYEG
jgi:serine/threonine protein kinase